MSSDMALRIDGLGKRYVIRHQDHDHVTMAQAALHRLRHPRGGHGREEFWALRDVSLEVPRGEVLGVIGHNGAGKSTLLKILSRITPPTVGRVEVFGRIGSLLEVGTGFHPELTARENIYLNGSILGMRRREIDAQFDAIVDFSGVGRFLDTPVKRFSSGMYVRLAFSVAAHLDTDILLLDEVLAVGDPDFQQRAVAQIKRMAQDGRTVLFVSHNRELVEQITRTAVAMERGAVVDSGRSVEVLRRQYRRKERHGAFVRQRGLGEVMRLDSAVGRTMFCDDGSVAFQVELSIVSPHGCSRWRPNFTLRSSSGASVGSTFGPVVPAVRPGGTDRVTLQTESLSLAPGDYSVDVSLSVAGRGEAFELVDLVSDACVLSTPDLPEGIWQPQWGSLKLRTHRIDIQTEGLGRASAVESVEVDK